MIYDEKNFKIATSRKKRRKEGDAVYMNFTSSKKVQLLVFAKSKECIEGTCSVYAFYIYCKGDLYLEFFLSVFNFFISNMF